MTGMSVHAQNMKYEHLKFSVMALDAKQFQSAKQCRTITDKSQQNQIAQEMIDSLSSVMNRQELIDRYVEYYSAFPILAVIYTKEIVNLALTEQREMLRSFIDQSDSPVKKLQYEDICTGYINMKSSLLFPELWPHPHHNLPRMTSFSEEYIAFLSSKKDGWIRRSKIFETVPEGLMEDELFWDLTGIHAQHSLDNDFFLVTKNVAARILDETKDRNPEKIIQDEHLLFSSFLDGVLHEKMLLIFEYSE